MSWRAVLATVLLFGGCSLQVLALLGMAVFRSAYDRLHCLGRGRELRAVGVLFVLGGLLLAAIPPFTIFAGKSLIEASASAHGYGWLIAVFLAVSALTGGAVLRVAGRVFLGCGPAEGPDPTRLSAREDDELKESRAHTPVLMVLVPGVLLALALGVGLIPGAMPAIERGALRFADHRAYASWVLHARAVLWPALPASHVSADDVLYGVLSLLGALAVAGLGLFGRTLRERLPARPERALRGGLYVLRGLHSGHIGDYIAWWTAGAGVFGAVCLLALA